VVQGAFRHTIRYLCAAPQAQTNIPVSAVQTLIDLFDTVRGRAPKQALDVVLRYRPDRRSAAQFEGPQHVSERLDRYPKRQRGECRCRHELCGGWIS
jgi:hypothetical protein